MRSMVTVPRTLAHEGDRQDGALQLLVVEGESITVHDLPEKASLLVGRGTEADIPLGDPGASARHARVHVDDGRVGIEDLGSRNGTQVRGQRIGANQRAELAPGEAALLGGVVVVLQRRTQRTRKRRVWPHGYFEARLTEECELAHGGGVGFSVVRIDLGQPWPVEVVAELAGDVLRQSDILGLYAPRAYEILLRRTAPEGAQRIVDALMVRLNAAGAEARAALAHYPTDGRSADELVSGVCRRLRPNGGQQAETRLGVVVLDERMREIYRLAEKAASGVINVLILGETGVGKEVLAETIHRSSRRADKPFLCFNCATLTDNLLESELFGHERGAFTDAKTMKPGLLESAAGGTVFLDEIGEMSPTLQAKLLRVIETKQVTRLGGLRATTIDVRFVSATHRDLVQEIRDKRFRSDLYYRINGMGLEIPPLRERRSEIRAFAEVFLEQAARQSELPRAPRLGDDAAALLESYDWPGNIRELRNVIERALLLSDGGDIEPDDLPLETLRGPSDLDRVAVGDIKEPVAGRWTGDEKTERAPVVDALTAEGGNQTRAARRLGISRGTLLARLERFEINRPQKRS
jgi:two-component system response regulator AtoC